MTMNKYVEENVSQKSYTTIKYFMKMLSSVSETLIFIFMGVSTVGKNHEWNWAFVCFTLIFCLIWRSLGVFVLTQIINHFRTIPLTFKDQFIIAYGGLRGAICFSLVFLLPSSSFPRKKLFITAAIVVIFFTVFIQGITIRPLVDFLDVKRSNQKQAAVSDEIHNRFLDHLKAGIEDVCGHWGHNYWRDKFKKFDNKYIRKLLIRENQPKSSIVSLYKKLEIKQAIEMAETGISRDPSLSSLQHFQDENKVKPVSPHEVDEMRDLLTRNLYQIRQRTLSYNRHNLTTGTNEKQAKEILIRRRHSMRESLRKDRSLSRARAATTHHARYLSLPGHAKLSEGHGGGNTFTVGDSDSEIEFQSATLSLQPRAGAILREQRMKRQPYNSNLKWKNELDEDCGDRAFSNPRMEINAKVVDTASRQPLFPKPRFGTLREEHLPESSRGQRPLPPPRTRHTSDFENQRGKNGADKPFSRLPK